MKATTIDVQTLFNSDVRYLIPIFQRNYKWNKDEHWAPLWGDVRDVADEILEFGEGPDLGDHFLGAIVCELLPTFGGDPKALSVIDGQQRLTTLQLLVAAVRKVAEERGAPHAGYLGTYVENQPFLVKDRKEYRYKIWPNVADRDGFMDAMTSGGGTTRPERAMAFFIQAIQEWLEFGDVDDPLDDADFTPVERLDALVSALTRHVQLVHIDLEPTDNAQVIFETLNGRGERLTDADLIRNYLFRKADEDGANAEQLHGEYWAPFDDKRWTARVAHGRHQRERLHMFINHWLSMRLLNEVPASAIFNQFKTYLERTNQTAEATAKDLATYAEVFDSFDHHEKNTPEWWFFRRVNEMDLITIYPVLLWVFGQGEEIPEVNRQRILRAIESFLIRRLIGRDSTRGYGGLFGDLLQRAADPAGSPTDADVRVIEFLASKTADTDRWPTNDEFRSKVMNTNVYKLKQSRLKMVLEGIEQKLTEGGHAEFVMLGHSLWIEHLLPQGWSAVQEWALPAGLADPTASAQQRDHLLHTLGNLTLTTSKLDIDLSNKPWATKVEMIQNSKLQLNNDICTDHPHQWDETSIATRGNGLCDLMLQIWPGPEALLSEVADRSVTSS